MFRQLALYSEFTTRRVLIIVNKIGSSLARQIKMGTAPEEASERPAGGSSLARPLRSE
jgi:hypothetical protein